MIVTKKDLVKKVAEATGLMRVEVLFTLEKLLEEIGNAMAEKKQVHIRGFGSFQVVHQSPRIARNVITGEEVSIPARYAPKLKFSKALKNKINEKRNSTN